MEEWIGRHWHRFVMRRAEAPLPPGAATLASLRPTLQLLLHAGGSHLRVAVATPLRVGGVRTPWQRVAGAGLRVPLAQVDTEVLALPEQVACFADSALNRELYLWWALLATQFDPTDSWADGNLRATAHLLHRYPAMQARWRTLCDAELARRAHEPPSVAEASLRAALQGGGPCAVEPARLAPVWVWLVPHAGGSLSGEAPGERAQGARSGSAHSLPARRRARDAAGQAASRTPLLLAAKTEWLKTFAEPFALDRAEDDEPDGDDRVAAEELDQIALQRNGGSLAARVRFDLDLPAAAQDDLPVGEGEWLPEWDPRSQRLVPERVCAQRLAARHPEPWQPSLPLRTLAAQLRRRMAVQQAAPRWRHGRLQGESIDIDAWVRHQGHRNGAAAVYSERTRSQRELATLLLADLSLSTDAHASNEQRVIEVIRDALWTFGEALHGSGDAFALLGFSSVRRNLRLHELKAFDEAWGEGVRARLGALKPGYYTRLGAALRAATRQLQQRPERQRLLLLLTDGKPHDLDGYEGRLGQEDIRQAVLEARRAGLLPFAVSIDEAAPQVLPHLFGAEGWAWVRRPAELPQRLAGLYGQLSRR